MSLTFVSCQEAASYMPQDAKRVHVREEDGTIRWKTLSDVLDTDAICFKNGKPMTMKSHPGRPSAHRSVPAPAGLAQGMGQPVAPEIVRNNDRKKKSVASNPLYQQICADPYEDGILSQIMKELAEEAAALKFERKRADQTGKDPIALSVRRVATLQSMADTWFKRREQMATKAVDLKSPAFARLYMYIVDTFVECMEKAGVEEATVSNVTLELSRLFKENKDWEAGAKEAMRNA